MTDTTNVDVATQEAVNPEISENGTDTGTHDEGKKKNSIQEQFDRFKQKLDEKDQQLAEKDKAHAEEIRKLQRKWAVERYGEEAFESEEYKAVVENPAYASLDYDAQMAIARIQPSHTSQPTKTGTPWRSPLSPDEKPSTISRDELLNLMDTDYQKYKEYSAEIKAKRMQLN